MVIVGSYDGRSFRRRIRARNSALLFEVGFVPYAGGSN